MQTRPLGRTGHNSTVMAFGAVAFWHSDQAQANTILDFVLDNGINHIDVAPQYGNAQQVVGGWLKPHRDQFFLGCKTLKRTREEAWADLHNSLKLLNTDVIDLYQMHAIATEDDLNRAFAPDGVMETLVEARDQGKVRFLGLTSHGMKSPALQIEALSRFDFDTVMFPMNPRLYADPDYRRDAERLLQIAQERSVGVMIIKAAAKGPWDHPTDQPRAPWYQPHQNAEEIEKGVRFALSQPGVSLAVSVGNRDLMPLFLQAAERFTPMSASEQAALIDQRGDTEELIFVGTAFNTPD